MEEYLSQLNEQQREAVAYIGGPSLVIAGAGSGKTRVLTYKIVHLLKNGYEPWRILALTFTNKAAREMRERIEQLVGASTARKLWMGTFHSIFARILRNNADRIGYKSSFTIYDTSDSKSLVKSIVKDMGLDDKIYKPSVVLSAISWAKNALISPEAYASDRELMKADKDSRRPELYAVYRTYRDRCFAAGAMDFDDLLYYTNVLLRDNADILRHYQEFFRFVMVDEYQDTNFAQHVIVSQLCRVTHNLCVVGDDAQSIYSFRGANILNIINMKQSYPELEIFKLERNYRSTKNITEAANSLIAKNTEGIPKKVFSENESGPKVEVVQSYSDYEESYLIANRISQVKMDSRDSYEEFAILYRTNAQSRLLEESLRKRNIPYRIYGGLSFYQRKEVKDAIAYFRLAVNPDDDEALKRVINYPARGIGETTLNRLIRCAIDNNVSIWTVISDLERYNPGVNSGTARKLSEFRSLINSFISLDSTRANAFVMARSIIEGARLMAAFMSDHTPETISKRENLSEIISGARQFVEEREEQGDVDLSLGAFLGEISLATDQDSDDSGEERVTLMTAHAAKGLEFANVFIAGVEEELFPSAMSADTLRGVEEERRLLYVAITRAKKFCMLSFANSRFRNGQTAMCKPSRFLGDIDPEFLCIKGSANVTSPGTMRNPIETYRSSFHSPRSLSPLSRQSRPAGRSAAATCGVPVAGGFGLHSVDEISEGMTIEHSRFGRGVIVKIDRSSGNDSRMTVDFENIGSKLLLLKFAQFKIIGL